MQEKIDVLREMVCDRLELAMGDSYIRQKIHDRFVDMIFHENMHGVVSGIIAMLMFYVFLLLFDHDWKVHVWILANLAIYFGRFAAVQLYNHGRFLGIKYDGFRLSDVNVAATGVMIGLSCTTLLMIVFSESYGIASKYIVTFGLMLFFSGSLMLNSNIPIWFIPYTFFSAIPMILLLLSQGGIFMITGVSLVYYFLFMFVMSMKAFRLNFESYFLRYQNERFMKELENSKAQLEHVVDDLKRNNKNLTQEVRLRKSAEKKIRKMASIDVLTGVTNRISLEERMLQAIAQAQRTKTMVGIFFVDIDRFKFINDTYGHVIGDELLRSVANRLSQCVRSTDEVSRIGGDEFVLLLTNVMRAEDILSMAQNILTVLEKPYTIKGKNIVSNVSIGISFYPQNGGVPEDLIRNADVAMYQAKQVPGNSFFFFTSEMNEVMARRLHVEKMLQRAIQNDEFQFYFQPIISLSTGKIVAAELLVRFAENLMREEGDIGPSDFIPVAEDIGLIGKIGLWGVEETCRILKKWENTPLSFEIDLALNISIKHLIDPNFFDDIKSRIDKYQINPHRLVLEITESQAIENKTFVRNVLEKIAGLGVRLSIDDFGTGHSNFSYLLELPVSKIKIDRSFLKEIGKKNGVKKKDREHLVQAIISVSKALGLETVAEGVETMDQFLFLREQNCDYVQGYLFSKPVPEEVFLSLIQEESFDNQFNTDQDKKQIY